MFSCFLFFVLFCIPSHFHDVRNHEFYIAECWIIKNYFWALCYDAVMLLGVSLMFPGLLLNCAKTGPAQPFIWS